MKKKIVTISLIILFVVAPIVNVHAFSLSGDYNKPAQELVNNVLGSGVVASNSKKQELYILLRMKKIILVLNLVQCQIQVVEEEKMKKTLTQNR